MSTNRIETATKLLLELERTGMNKFESHTDDEVVDVNSSRLLKKFEESTKSFDNHSKGSKRKAHSVDHFPLTYNPLKKHGSDIELTQTKRNILKFVQEAKNFQISYDDRFHVPNNSNTYASEELVEKIKEMFFILNIKSLAKVLVLKETELKYPLQLTLMGILKQLFELEAQNLAKKYTDISLEQHRLFIIGDHFDSLEHFQHYMASQLQGSKKHLISFRFLFPLAEPGGEVPMELDQSKIKPFIDQIEAVFNLVFSEEKPTLINYNCKPCRSLIF